VLVDHLLQALVALVIVAGCIYLAFGLAVGIADSRR
jgi:hypothetical protein